QDPVGVARAAAIQDAVAHVARKERGHTVEMRRQHDDGIVEPRDDVEPAVGDRLTVDVIPASLELGGEPRAGRLLAPGRRIDVDERAGERNEVQRIHASRAVRADVRSSRYFTMIGVATDSPHSRPRPLVTGRVPGTTTAPSGMTSGCPATGSTTRSFGRSYTGVEPVRMVPAASTARRFTIVPS